MPTLLHATEWKKKIIATEIILYLIQIVNYSLNSFAVICRGMKIVLRAKPTAREINVMRHFKEQDEKCQERLLSVNKQC